MPRSRKPGTAEALRKIELTLRRAHYRATLHAGRTVRRRGFGSCAMPHRLASDPYAGDEKVAA